MLQAFMPQSDVSAQLRRLTAAALCAMCAAGSMPVSAKDYPVDDSYSISQRFYAYRDEHPELKEPVLSFTEGQQVLFDRRYKVADDRELHLDVFLPSADKANDQAIMFIHGGGWRSGNKSHFYPLANLLAQQGYVVITPEYRLSMEAQYPAGLEDINDALAFAKEHAAAWGFNPTRIALGGGSSGGHMAGLIGNTANTTLFKGEHSADAVRVNAVVDLDGVLDFTHPLALASENKRKDKSAAGMWFGGAYETLPERWAEASTAKHIDAHSPPMLIISSGQMRFTAGKDEVLSKLSSHGIVSKYYQYDNNIHTFWLFEPYLTETAERIHTFLSQIASGVNQ